MLVKHLHTLEQHAERLKSQCISDLLVNDRQRFARYSRRVGPLLLDFSKQKLDDDAFSALGEIAAAAGWEEQRDAMFRGEVVNVSEQRAVLHTALRAAGHSSAPRAIHAEVAQTLTRMAAIVDALHTDQAQVIGLPADITDVVNLGIGGSDLGPRLGVEALRDFHLGKFAMHFLPNVDGGELATLLSRLNPKHTLVLLVSKSFTTQETLLNGTVLKRWIEQAYEGDTASATRHFIAVTANVAAAKTFGVSEQRILPMWDWVGGRYSVWSAVGLVLALAIGMPRFYEFLAGAAAIDKHFCSAPWNENLPVLLALIGIWNRNAEHHPTLAVIPYDDRLNELPAYLQQLEMESLGKSVSANGVAVTYPTVPVIWGHVGTNAQHAFFQALHQGTDIVPVSFIGVIKPAHTLRENHAALLANLLAQSAALMGGKSFDQALEELSDAPSTQRSALAAQRTFPGDRPSSTLLIDQLTPHSLGELLALHEHKVFVQSCIWGINAFDQWGVELGKQIAKTILPAVSGEAAAPNCDASTTGLIAEISKYRTV